MNTENVPVIAVHSAKGGVGKSTTAVNMAAALAMLGNNVVLVDTDSQGHASLMLAMPDENGLYNLLVGRKPLDEVIRLVPTEQYNPPGDGEFKPGKLWLLPSSDMTYKIPREIKADEIFIVLDALEQIAEAYKPDVIIMDTSPSLTEFDGALWMAIDWFLFITECERLSVDGLQSAVERMKRFGQQRERYLGRPSRIMGILPNKLKANTFLHRTVIGQLATNQDYAPYVWSPVVDRIAWAEAAYMQKTIFQHQPNGQAARDAWATVRKFNEVLHAE